MAVLSGLVRVSLEYLSNIPMDNQQYTSSQFFIFRIIHLAVVVVEDDIIAFLRCLLMSCESEVRSCDRIVIV